MNDKQNIIVLSKIFSNGRDIWTVIEYKRYKKYSDAKSFVWVPNGINCIFKTRNEAIAKIAAQKLALYESKVNSNFYACAMNLEKNLMKVL